MVGVARRCPPGTARWCPRSTKRHRSSTCPWVSSPGDPLVQPDGALDPQQLREHRLVVLALKARVAHLHLGVQQALLGGQQGAGAVDVDGPALQHHVAARGGGPGAAAAPAWLPPAPGSGRRASSPGYFAQALKRKRAITERPLPSSSRTKIGPKSRDQMRLVGKRRKLTRSRSTPMCTSTRRALVSWAGVVDQQLDPLAGGQLLDDVAVDPGDGAEPAGPVGHVVGEGQPGGLVAASTRPACAGRQGEGRAGEHIGRTVRRSRKRCSMPR